MIYKYKYAPLSPLQDQNKTTQYMVKMDEYQNGFTILDDLSITTLGEVVKSGNDYKVLLFGSHYTTIDQNLNSSCEELQVVNTDTGYTIKLSGEIAAAITLEKGSVLIHTDETAKLVLVLSLAIILADKTYKKNKTADIKTDSLNLKNKIDFKKTLSAVVPKLKTLKKAKSNPLKLVKMCSLLLGVMLIIGGIAFTIKGTYSNSNLHKTKAMVSSNGESISFQVGALKYSLKLNHTESKGSQITVYYTLSNDGKVNNIYYKPPVAYGNLVPSALGVVMVVGSICIKGRKACKNEKEN